MIGKNVYTYDREGKLTSEGFSHNDSEGFIALSSFYYDTAGNIVKSKNEVDSTRTLVYTYTFYTNGKIASKEEHVKNQSGPLQYSWKYDQIGNETEISDGRYSTTKKYDKYNRVVSEDYFSIADGWHQYWRHFYNKKGYKIKDTWQEGDSIADISEFRYNNKGQNIEQSITFYGKRSLGTLKYDTHGLKIEENWTDDNGSVSKIFKYRNFDKQRNWLNYTLIEDGKSLKATVRVIEYY